MGARLSEALIARAIRAAKREGCGIVEVKGGAIRILVDEAPAPPASSGPAGGDDTWADEFDKRVSG